MIGKKEFAAVAFDPKYKTFVVYVVALNVDLGDEVHLLRRVKVAYLKVDEAPTKVSSKYADFIDVFFLKLIIQLPKYIEINNYAIKLVDN